MTNTLKLLQDLIAIPSHRGEGNPFFEAKINQYLQRYFKSHFPQLYQHIIPFGKSRQNLAFLGSSSPRVILACHTDTTPPISRTQLTPTQKGDKVVGLGAKDMKGGIVSSLLALPLIKDKSKVAVIFYGDEEYQQKGMSQLVKVLPSLLKKGVGLIISPESRFNLGYGSRGIMVIKLTIKGKAAHSARPHLGIDAVKGFYEIVKTLEKQFSRATELGVTTLTITKIEGGSESITGKVVDSHGSVPNLAEGTISVRNALPSLSSTRLIQAITRVAKKTGLRVTHTQIIADYPVRQTDPRLAQKIKRLVLSQTGLKIDLGDPKTAGYNDAALLGASLKCPVINFGPYGEGNHTPQEWVSLTSIEQTARVLAAIVNHW